jgi:hypothetical protein
MAESLSTLPVIASNDYEAVKDQNLNSPLSQSLDEPVAQPLVSATKKKFVQILF